MHIFSSSQDWQTDHRAILQPGGSPFWCVVTDLPSPSCLTSPWRVAKPPDGGRRIADIVIRPFAQPARASDLLGHLAPTEQLSCSGGDGIDIYCFDGRLRLPSQVDKPLHLSPLHPDSIPGIGALTTGLCYALSAAGGLVLHAGCFMLQGKRVLVLGQSGSGKSTLCAAAIHAGGRVLSDDSVLVDATGIAYPLRRDLSLRKPSLGMLSPHTIETLTRQFNGLENKWFLLRQQNPGAYLDRMEIDETWILRRPSDREQPSKTPVDAATALRYLMDNTHFLANPSYGHLQATLLPAACRLVEQNQNYLVDTTTGLVETPQAVLSSLT